MDHGSAFCVSCGFRLAAAPAARTAAPGYVEPHEQEPEAGKVFRAGDVTVKIEGELVPVVDVILGGRDNVYFEHHTLLWKQPQVNIVTRSLKGAVKRFFAGLQIFVTETQGSGNIAFSRDAPGQIVPILLRAGEEVHVREHQFLLASGHVDYDYFRVKGVANILFGGTGFFIDSFKVQGGEGLLLLHGYGNVFTKELRAGESLDIEPGAFLWKDASVKIDTVLTNLSTGFFGGVSFTINRFTGPGRVGIQSMSYHPPQAGSAEQTTPGDALVRSVVKGIFD
ncbi:MAG: AIM24 family protein [Deltaproteobacteria bacterium]|nr:AIM24 family protein [Deltaproteobacteria bacterium]